MPRPLPAARKRTRKGTYLYTFGIVGGGGLLGHDKQIKRSRSAWERTCSVCKHSSLGDGRRCPNCARVYERDGWMPRA